MTTSFDPLATSTLIVEGYRRYLKSLLAVRDPGIAAALDHEIAQSRLTKGPLLEAAPPYQDGATLADLVAEGVLNPAFPGLTSPAVPLDRPLYLHQEQAIRKISMGRNVIVATGTGSGKTESFLLPILDALTAEQAAGTLGPGVRALLLYPMNALANDQIKRLREALAGAPHITFGRYVGDTPRTAREAAETFAVLNPGQPRLPNELLSRAEMRDSPPHLLLTNYAMLEYLLLRPADIELFEGVHGGHWRFIAVDEAHVYDGARAAELAMLLRRLRDRVTGGRPLRCIATSATVGDDPGAVTEFARRLFDAVFEWAPDDPSRQDLVRATTRVMPQGPFWGPLDPASYLFIARAADPDSEVLRLAEARGVPGYGDAVTTLAHERRIADLRALLAARPRPFPELAAELFDPGIDREQALAALVTAGARVRDGSGTAVLSARYHLFTRASEGAYSPVPVKAPTPACRRRARTSAWPAGKRVAAAPPLCSSSARANAAVPCTCPDPCGTLRRGWSSGPGSSPPSTGPGCSRGTRRSWSARTTRPWKRPAVPSTPTTAYSAPGAEPCTPRVPRAARAAGPGYGRYGGCAQSQTPSLAACPAARAARPWCASSRPAETPPPP